MISTLKTSPAVSVIAYYDNDALIPELWALESLLQLEKLSVFPWLVYRDYGDDLANFGDTVNAHRPAVRTMSRKGTSDPIVTDNANSETLPVVLNQHVYDSF